MGQANSLSRRTNWTEEVERDNENQVMLKKKWLEIRAMKKEQLLIGEAEKEIIEKIKKSEVKNNEIVKVVDQIKKTRVKVLKNDEQQIKDELVLKEKKIYILKNKSLRLKIIWLYHDTLITKHRGQWKMVELVIRNYRWPEVVKEMKQYVEDVINIRG